MTDTPAASFVRLGPAAPRFPVILSVPHAGRDYPDALLRASRIDRAGLALLEDRHADLLVGQAVASGFTTLVARRPRAWIDLNRHEREIDPDMIAPPPRGGLVRSARVTGGLGLIPRRLRGHGEVLSGPVASADLEARIAEDHRPYHRALAELLSAARARFGIAILLDVHSMPPLSSPPPTAQIVLGDRFGRSAGARLAEVLRDVASRAGLRTADNIPYSGGYILDTHGAPAREIHALQIEFDRALYLDDRLDAPREGLGGIDTLLRAMAIELAREAMGAAPFAAIAAE